MANRWKISFVVVIVVATMLFGVSLLEPDGDSVGATTLLQVPEVDTTGFAHGHDRRSPHGQVAPKTGRDRTIHL